MQPVVAKRRTPKITKENKPSTIEEGIRYFMDIENTCIPVSLLVYGNPDYRQSLGNNYFEGNLQEIFEKDESIPLDINYLTFALQDGRLWMDSDSPKKIKEVEKRPLEKRSQISDGIYQEIDKAYSNNPKSVYYKYLDAIKRLSITPSKKHLEYIADKMKYEKGWIHYKEIELKLK